MRAAVAILACAVLPACGSGGGQPTTATSPAANVPSVARIESCVDRLLGRSATNAGNVQPVRRYARDTYCAPFARNGWIDDDGALSIAAQKWLDDGHRQECTTGGATTPTRTVPCEADRVIDCALHHHIRRAEVGPYIADRQRSGAVRCDDGSPLEDLGVP